MSKKPFSLWTDQDICNWFDGLDEDYIRSLIDLHGDYDITPRKAFHYVFGDLDSQHCTCQACRLSLSPVPAQERQSESVAAPAEVGQGQGTHSLQDFSDWLALRLNQAQRGSYPNRLSGESDSSYKFRCDEAARALCLVQCLILGFKLEHGV